MLCVSAKKNNRDAEELAGIRKQLRLTQTEMAERLGLSFPAYKSNEYRKPTPAVLDDARSLLVQETRGLYGVRSRAMGKLRVLGAVGAGGSPDYEGDEETILVPLKFCRPDFGAAPVPADADSMMPIIHPGDTLIFRNWTSPRLGKILGVKLRDEPWPIAKKCIFKDGQMMLHSFNDRYPDVPLENARVLGYLVGFISVDDSIIVGPEENGIDEAFILSAFGSRLPS